jgi:hypothetical protein
MSFQALALQALARLGGPLSRPRIFSLVARIDRLVSTPALKTVFDGGNKENVRNKVNDLKTTDGSEKPAGAGSRLTTA